MKNWIVLCLILGCSATAFAKPKVKDLNWGKIHYDTCKNCHGHEGEGNPAIGAPSINGMPDWYISSSLKKYQQGIRGAHHEDVPGLRMRPMSRHLKTDKDVDAVSKYIASLAPVKTPATLDGDPEKGKTLYMTCLACHGPEGQGNPQLKSPPINLLADWYIVAQLKNFRNGKRGSHPKDIEGQQMKPMAMMLANDQALKDVAAYIITLKGSAPIAKTSAKKEEAHH
jgi:cytochrome c oxidase subunit 2